MNELILSNNILILLCKQHTDVTSAYIRSPSHKHSGNQFYCMFHQYNVNKLILLHNILVLLGKQHTDVTSAYMQSPGHKYSGDMFLHIPSIQCE